MAAKKRALHIATEADARRPANLLEAVQAGDRKASLEFVRDTIAMAVMDPACPKRELASLSKRLTDVLGELEALKSAEGDGDLGSAASVPDEEFDAEAL